MQGEPDRQSERPPSSSSVAWRPAIGLTALVLGLALVLRWLSAPERPSSRFISVILLACLPLAIFVLPRLFARSWRARHEDAREVESPSVLNLVLRSLVLAALVALAIWSICSHGYFLYY